MNWLRPLIKLATRLWQNSKLNSSCVGSYFCVLIVVLYLVIRVLSGAFAESPKVSIRCCVSSKLLLIFLKELSGPAVLVKQ